MMKPKDTPDYRSDVHGYTSKAIKRISWGSIFAGTFIVLAVQATLVLLGMAVGFSTINPATEQNPFGGLGVGAYIWWTVSFIISLFIGGWIAGRLSGIPSRLSGALHGLVSWSFATIITMYMLTSTVGVVVGGAFGIMKTAVGGTAAAIGAVAPAAMQSVQTGQAGSLRDQLSQLINPSGPDSVQNQQLSQAVRNILSNPAQASEQDKDMVANALAQRTSMTLAEARQNVDKFISEYQSAQQMATQAGQQARVYGQQAADVLAAASLWAFIMMVLGGISAAVGGLLGAPFDEGTRAYYAEEYVETRKSPITGEREPAAVRK